MTRRLLACLLLVGCASSHPKDAQSQYISDLRNKTTLFKVTDYSPEKAKKLGDGICKFYVIYSSGHAEMWKMLRELADLAQMTPVQYSALIEASVYAVDDLCPAYKNR
jgi:hypothetical protein